MSELRQEREDGIAVLTLDRPARRNALGDALREELAVAVDAVADDPGIRCVILAGAGGHFCAGGDVNELARLSGEKDLALLTRRRLKALHRWLRVLVEMEKPVIAAVDGVAYGAGLSLALAADYVIATPRARFCAVFAKTGLVPDAGAMYLLPRRVGLARAKELVFSARVVAAQEACAIGLADAIADDPVGEAKALAAGFLAPQAIGIAKTLMNRSFESGLGEVLENEALAQALCRTMGPWIAPLPSA